MSHPFAPDWHSPLARIYSRLIAKRKHLRLSSFDPDLVFQPQSPRQLRSLAVVDL